MFILYRRSHFDFTQEIQNIVETITNNGDKILEPINSQYIGWTPNIKIYQREIFLILIQILQK